MLDVVKITVGLLACLASGWWLPAMLFNQEARKNGPLFWTLACLTGLLTTYALIVAQAPIVLLWLIHGVLILAGLFRGFLRGPHSFRPTRLFYVLFFLVSLSILLTPLKDWDARSIWFFHAKIFHFENLKVSSTWVDPSIGFSHPHYPHFFPLMAAYVLSPWPVWNAYLPKISLLLLWIPLCFGFLALTQNIEKRRQLYLGLGLFGLPGALLWNGYMDAYLAGFFVLGTLSLKQFFENSAIEKAWMASLFYAICVLLKQEESALVLISVFATLVHFRRKYQWHHLWLVGPIVIAFGLHLWIKKQIPTTDYLLDSSSLFTSFYERIGDPPSLALFGKYLLKHFWNFVLFAVALRVGLKIWTFSSDLFTTIAGLYAVVLSFIYLSTSFPLQWYLDTSSSRTFLVVQILLLFHFLLSMKSDVFISEGVEKT